jgi:hypothetical protein
MGLGGLVKVFFAQLGLKYLPFVVGTSLALGVFQAREEYAVPDNKTRIIARCSADYGCVSPDASRMIFSTNQLNEQRELQTYISGLNGENLQPVFDKDDGEYFREWSPDGNKFLFSRSGGLWAYDLAARREKMVFAGEFFYEDWSSDSKIISFYDRNNSLHFFDFLTGKSRVVEKAKTGPYIPKISWNNGLALFKHGQNLASFSVRDGSLEELVNEPVLLFDWAGNKAVCVSVNEPDVLRVHNPEDSTYRLFSLGKKPVMLCGSDGVVAFASENSAGNELSVLSLETGRSGLVGSWPCIYSLSWRDSLLAIGVSGKKRPNPSQDDVCVYDASKKQLKKLTGHGSEFLWRWARDGRLLVRSDADNPMTHIPQELYALSLDGRMERLTRFGLWEEEAMADYHAKSFGLMAIAGLAGLLGIYGSWRARKARVRLEGHRGIDKLLDYPGLVAFGASAGLLGCITYLGGSSSAFFESKTSGQLLLGAGFAATTASMMNLFYGIADIFSRVKSPCLRNGIKMFCCSARAATNSLRGKNYPEENARMLELQACQDDKTLVMQAIDEARRQNLPYAVHYLNSAFQSRLRKPALARLLSTNWIEQLGRRVALFVAEKAYGLRAQDDLVSLTTLQFEHVVFGNNKKALAFSEKILDLPDCTDQDRVLQAFILENIGEKSLSKKLLDYAVPRLIKNSDGRSEARSGGQILAFKPGERLVFEKEIINLEYCLRSATRFGFEVSRPLGIFSVNDRDYLCEVYADGKRLDRYLLEKPDSAVMRENLRVTGILHGIMPCRNGKSIDSDICALVERAPWPLRPALLDAVSGLVFPFWQYQAFDSDAHQQNRNWNFSGQITVFDLEDRGSCPVAYDYAKASRQGVNPCTPGQESEFLESAVEQYNRLVGRERRIPGGVMQEFVCRASPVKALSRAYAFWNRPEEARLSLGFLNNAWNDLQLLKENRRITSDEYHVLADEMGIVSDELQRLLE